MAVIDGLVAYYSLEEASGNATDAYGSKTLTDNGSVGTGTGKVGTARDFEQSTPTWLDRADSAFSATGDFTVQAWVKPEGLAGHTGTWGAGIAAYMSGSSNQYDWWLASAPDGSVVFAHFTTAGVNLTGLRTTGTGKLADATWAHVVARLSGSTFTVWVNGVSESLSTASTASGWANIGFTIGRIYPGGVYCFDGLIDEAAFWSEAKSDADIAWLYNSGAGRSYADIVSEGGTFDTFRPTGVLSAGSWTANPSGTLYGVTSDESDSTSAQSSSGSGSDTLDLSFTAMVEPPAGTVTFYIRHKAT